MQILYDTYRSLLARYTDDEKMIRELWTEIESNYSGTKRYYHTLEHLDDLLKKLSAIKSRLNDWDTCLFTLYYHDIVYNPRASDNEEKSADHAALRMKQLGIAEETISRCHRQILATKAHTLSADSDTNYFTDADLSILGEPWELYARYSKNVRKEYSIYPDFLYNPGRKKALNHFLEMGRIFKTDSFHTQFENQARENLRREIDAL